MISPSADRPVYLQVADRLRVHIGSGQLRLGQKLPSESELISLFGVSRVSVRRAVDVLRSDGIVVTKHGAGSFVCRTGPVQRITLTYRVLPAPEGCAVWLHESVQARMPSPEEMARLGIPEGMPVLVITRRTPSGIPAGSSTQVVQPLVVPADRVMIDYVPDVPLDPHALNRDEPTGEQHVAEHHGELSSHS